MNSVRVLIMSLCSEFLKLGGAQIMARLVHGSQLINNDVWGLWPNWMATCLPSQ